MTTWRVLHGDMRLRLADVPEASLDACVTDPPYGLEFMLNDRLRETCRCGHDHVVLPVRADTGNRMLDDVQAILGHLEPRRVYGKGIWMVRRVES